MLSEGYSDVPFKEPFPPGRLRWAICYILWYILRERHRLWANVFAYSWISCKIKSNNLQNSILVLGPIIFVLDFSIYKLTALWIRYLCWLKCRYLCLVQVKGQWHAFLGRKWHAYCLVFIDISLKGILPLWHPEWAIWYHCPIYP